MTEIIPDKYVNEVCRVGAGVKCCRYLAIAGGAGSGWQCAKNTTLQPAIDERVEAGEFNARSDNCPGWHPGWYKKFQDVREAFLSLIADSSNWGVEYDADTNSAGRQIDCSTFYIDGPLRSLEALCEALDIKKSRIDQSLDDAIQEA